jgi:hypothetical protein
MGRVRAYVESDAERVLVLHQRAFLQGRTPTKSVHKALNSYYSVALFEHPWRGNGVESLVYETDSGDVIAFLGAIARPMLFEDTTIWAAVVSSFMVDPAVRSPIPAVSLLRQCLRGPQDLTIGDGGNNQMKQIWEAMGNAVFPFQSLKWWRAFRPCSFYLRRLTRERSSPWNLLWYLGRVPCALIDFVSARVPGSPTRASKPPNVEGLPLATSDLLQYIRRASQGAKLRPAYDEESLQWLLDYVDAAHHPDGLERIAVVDKNGDVLGWYVLRVRSNRAYEVLQMGGFKKSMDLLLKHLFARAAGEGASIVQGRLEASAMKDLWDNGCMFKRGPWRLAHSPNTKILDALATGDAFISSLENELLSLTL